MISKDDLKLTIDFVLKAGGFKRKGQSWYFDGPDNIIVVNLQRSAWDEQYYLNIGFWLKALGITSFPQHNKCHLYYRVESLFIDKRDLIQKSTLLTNSNPQLLSELSEFMSYQLLPFLLECGDEKNLKSLMSQGTLDRGYVRLEARWHLLGE